MGEESKVAVSVHLFNLSERHINAGAGRQPPMCPVKRCT
jgi:hypothetical protein